MDLKKQQSNVIWSKRVRAGKRTYFFDIKKDSKGQSFISISESRKTRGGLKKQMIVIYPEDLEKFYEVFREVKNNLT